MTTPEERAKREKARLAMQRAALVVSSLTLVLLIVAIVLQINRNGELDKASDANRATICAAARLISVSGVTERQGEKPEAFKKRLAAAAIFLRLAAHIDCKAVLLSFGIKVPDNPTTPKGGDAQSPQTGSQLPRPGALRPPGSTLTLNLGLRVRKAHPGSRGSPGNPANPASRAARAHPGRARLFASNSAL